jgi:hypothetical protein
MERWQLDLKQIRQNWERGSTLPTAQQIAPTAKGPAPANAAAEKVCPGCGTELSGGGSPPPGKSSPAATSTAITDVLDPPRTTLPSRFTGIQAPIDPYPEAQALLTRVRTLAHRQLTAHEPLLSPFFDETTQILQGLAEKPGEGQGPPADKKKLRTELDRALGDLEDLVALWSGVAR